MRSVSIDELTDQIHSSKTKGYFDEVIKSYYTGNYRSAVVMLYSVVICDIMYKLNELTERYDDEVAHKILEDVKNTQVASPKSSEWERILIERTHKDTQLLDVSEYTNIQFLQNHRNLSAHPVLKDTLDLFRPNKETVRAHIVNMLDGVLTKPALMSRKIFDEFLSDIAEVKDQIVDTNKFERYILSKYLNNIRMDVEYAFFKSLWKLVFGLEDEKCDDNREINYKAFIIILQRYYDVFSNRFKDEAGYYSSHIDLDIKGCLKRLVTFFNAFPKLFEYLSDDCKVRIEELIKKDDGTICAMAYFLEKDIKTHTDKIVKSQTVDTESALYLYDRLCDHIGEQVALDFLISVFALSLNYDSADGRYSKLIYPHLEEFDEKQFKKIIKAINTNSQIYNRRMASSSNRQIKQEAEARQFTIDWTKYPNFHC